MILPFAVALAAGVLLAGCGGDDEGGKNTGTVTLQETATQTETSETATAPTKTTRTTNTGTSPESQPGGAGDEEPARSQALFTGRGGRITPTVIRVPSYIAIRVVLRSADGRAYGLRFNGKTLRVGGSARSATADFAGLRPGKALAGEAVDGGNSVRVEATAEPGP